MPPRRTGRARSGRWGVVRVEVYCDWGEGGVWDASAARAVCIAATATSIWSSSGPAGGQFLKKQVGGADELDYRDVLVPAAPPDDLVRGGGYDGDEYNPGGHQPPERLSRDEHEHQDGNDHDCQEERRAAARVGRGVLSDLLDLQRVTPLLGVGRSCARRRGT